MNDADKLIEAVANAIRHGIFGNDYEAAYWTKENDDAARAALSAIETAGWAVVPVEPTIKMCDAAMELVEKPSRTGWQYVPKAPGDAWRMMLSARPRITGETE